MVRIFLPYLRRKRINKNQDENKDNRLRKVYSSDKLGNRLAKLLI